MTIPPRVYILIINPHGYHFSGQSLATFRQSFVHRRICSGPNILVLLSIGALWMSLQFYWLLWQANEEITDMFESIYPDDPPWQYKVKAKLSYANGEMDAIAQAVKGNHSNL